MNLKKTCISCIAGILPLKGIQLLAVIFQCELVAEHLEKKAKGF